MAAGEVGSINATDLQKQTIFLPKLSIGETQSAKFKIKTWFSTVTNYWQRGAQRASIVPLQNRSGGQHVTSRAGEARHFQVHASLPAARQRQKARSVAAGPVWQRGQADKRFFMRKAASLTKGPASIAKLLRGFLARSRLAEIRTHAQKRHHFFLMILVTLETHVRSAAFLF